MLPGTLAHRARLVAGPLVALAIGVGLVTMDAKADRAETPRVQESVRAAIDDAMDAGTYKAPSWDKGALDASTVQAMHANLDRRLKEHMTGRALAAWQQSLHEAIDRDSDGEHLVVTAGGTDRIEFGEIAVVGDRANAGGRAHVWVDWVIHKPGVTGQQSGHPVEWDGFRATLTRIDGNWYVDELTLKPEGDI
jgi:hypothetical protein